MAFCFKIALEMAAATKGLCKYFCIIYNHEYLHSMIFNCSITVQWSMVLVSWGFKHCFTGEARRLVVLIL